MARKKNPPDPSKQGKGRPLDVPPWLRAAIAGAVGGKGQQEIADEIFAATGLRWNRTRIGDFLRNNGATIEMADAFCVTYQVPKIFWLARSLSEALAFRREAAKYDAQEQETKDLASYDTAAAQLEDQLDSQTSLISSNDEVGTGRGRRTRRMGRGGA